MKVDSKSKKYTTITRTIPELLKLLFLYVRDSDYKRGLCVHTAGMCGINIITREEEDKLHDFIIKNRPKEGEPFYEDGRVIRQSGWNPAETITFFRPHFWNVENKDIRLEWLTYKIKQFK